MTVAINKLRSESMKVPVYVTEILWKPALGIYRQTTYFSDGSTEVQDIPKGPIVIPRLISY